jgi:nicotinate-nucleotide adenylyltransferase
VTPARRVGVLGGTFDPIHLGHVAMAEASAAEIGLDVVLLLANQTPPHKPPAEASAHHRHAMVALACCGDPRLVADPRELERPGPSYTVDTLERLREERPGDELFLVVGADSLQDFASWRRSGEILGLARLVVTPRAGLDPRHVLAAAAPPLRQARPLLVQRVPPGWSSTRIRDLVRGGALPEDALPGPVADYIRKNGLYAVPPPPAAAAPRGGSHA